MKNFKHISIFVSLTALTSCHLASEIKEGTTRTISNAKDAGYYLFTNKTPVEQIYYKEARRRPSKNPKPNYSNPTNPRFGSISPAQLDNETQNFDYEEYIASQGQQHNLQPSSQSPAPVNFRNSYDQPPLANNKFNQGLQGSLNSTENLNVQSYQNSLTQPKTVNRQNIDGFDYYSQQSSNEQININNSASTFPLDNYSPESNTYSARGYEADNGGIYSDNKSKFEPQALDGGEGYKPRQLSSNFPDLRDVPPTPSNFENKPRLKSDMESLIRSGRDIESNRKNIYEDSQTPTDLINTLERSYDNSYSNPITKNKAQDSVDDFETIKNNYTDSYNSKVENINNYSDQYKANSPEPFIDSNTFEVKSTDIGDSDSILPVQPKKSFIQRVLPFGFKKQPQTESIIKENKGYSFFGDDNIKSNIETKPTQNKGSFVDRVLNFGRTKDSIKSKDKKFNINEYNLPLSFDDNRSNLYDEPGKDLQPLKNNQDYNPEGDLNNLQYDEYSPSFAPESNLNNSYDSQKVAQYQDSLYNPKDIDNSFDKQNYLPKSRYSK